MVRHPTEEAVLRSVVSNGFRAGFSEDDDFAGGIRDWLLGHDHLHFVIPHPAHPVISLERGFIGHCGEILKANYHGPETGNLFFGPVDGMLYPVKGLLERPIVSPRAGTGEEAPAFRVTMFGEDSGRELLETAAHLACSPVGGSISAPGGGGTNGRFG